MTRKDRIQFLRADGIVGPPPPGFLRYGEPAVDENGNLYIGLSDNSIVRIAGTDIGEKEVAIYDTEAVLLAWGMAEDGIIGYAKDTGNSWIRVDGTWRPLSSSGGVAIFATEAALFASTPSFDGVLAYAEDTGNSYIYISTSSPSWRLQSSATGGGSGGHVIVDGTSSPYNILTQRSNLRFEGGVTVTDDAGNDTTVVTVASSIGGGGGGSIALFQTEATLLASTPAGSPPEATLAFAQDTGRSWVYNNGGAFTGWALQSGQNFLDLKDTPDPSPEDYTGQGGKLVSVDTGETGLEFTDSVDGGNVGNF